MKKIKSTYYIDYKSIIISLAFFLLIAISVLLIRSENLRFDYDKKLYNTSTKAFVYNIEEKSTITQGFDGASPRTIGYNLKYYYKVDNKVYSDSTFINSQLYDIINYSKENLNTWNFELKYSNKNPANNFMIIRED